MLRGIGLSLAVLGALATLAALQPIVRDLFEGWLRWDPLASQVYTLAFALCGVASGVILCRPKPVAREPLFQIGVLGVCLTAPLALLCVALVVEQYLAADESSAFLGGVFLKVWWDDWWPPQESLFCNTLMFSSPWKESLFWSGRPLHEPLGLVCGVGQSLLVWTLLPFAVCLRSIWGRPRKWIDNLFALIAVFVAVLLTVSAAETAWFHYQMASYPAGTEDSLNYIYLPQLSWYVFYALAIMLLVTLAILLFRRRAA